MRFSHFRKLFKSSVFCFCFRYVLYSVLFIALWSILQDVFDVLLSIFSVRKCPLTMCPSWDGKRQGYVETKRTSATSF
uniref:Uncharacterized protein n=1 Tax=Anopheles minimus TaxID=112268 RepID=A0A182WP16_9DIPT